ncbi:hypothetical protein [Pseudomonas syringae]|uniref:hypothetical protein n=1 Tax=Pseudomonas syringae TaxID=317 RepID=UPI001F42F37E|nr:hypothetical protein [Pseudomonas syringae]MCF5224043.1 hypothetical protein [Pseudomonas syringae]MCF5240167.1 hypothetical protein [Pseudomonas syringae]
MDTIFTLNARGNIFLEVTSNVFKVSQSRMMTEIQHMFKNTVRDLKKSGVDYAKLKTALIPSLEHNEIGLIFDSTAIESSSYGREAMQAILPFLDPRSTHSILAGDLVASNEQQELVYDILCESLIITRSFEYKHSNLLFCVYLTNVTDASLERIHEGLKSFSAYLGFIPTTYASPAKAYLSTILVNICIKRENLIILPHEDDRSNDENINITFYPFEDLGFKIRSIQSHDFSHFLSYKIERPTWPGFETDTHFSLNAISSVVSPLADMDIKIEDEKYEYLIKAGKLIKGDLVELDRDQLAGLIRSKIEASYIYNLRYLKDHDAKIFNVVIEVPRSGSGRIARMNVALEYKPDDHLLRMITFF